MRNHNYTTELILANQFIQNHKNDTHFMAIMKEAENDIYTYSERWYMIYNYLVDHYKGITLSLVTGLTLYAEEG